MAEAALPLTALLHCIDSINNPWWLGGNICAGVPYGAEIASKLGARLWISAHDAEKDVRGLATGLLKIRRWKDEEIEGALESGSEGPGNGQKTSHDNGQEKMGSAPKSDTEVLRLNCGEEILVAGTGQLWRTIDSDDKAPTSANLARETAVPPPVTLTGPTKIQHPGKYSKRALGAVALPRVQNAMSPKKLSIYKVLRAKDWIQPSPKLVIDREVMGRADSALPAAKRIPVWRPSKVKAGETAETTGSDGTAPKSEPSPERSVRFSSA